MFQRLTVTKNIFIFICLAISLNAQAQFGLATQFSQTSGELDKSWAPKISNIIAYWKFNGTAGANINNADLLPSTSIDGSPIRNLTATIATTTNTKFSDASPGTFKLNQSLVFSNSNNGNYFSSAESVFNFSGPFTIVFWMRPSTNFSLANQPIITKGNSTAYRISKCASGNFICFNSMHTTYETLQNTTPLAADTWYHVAAVWDGANKRIYINGVLESSSTPAGSLNNAGVNFTVGANTENFVLGYYKGSLDELIVWNTALSGDNIKTIYIRQSHNKK